MPFYQKLSVFFKIYSFCSLTLDILGFRRYNDGKVGQIGRCAVLEFYLGIQKVLKDNLKSSFEKEVKSEDYSISTTKYGWNQVILLGTGPN